MLDVKDHILSCVFKYYDSKCLKYSEEIRLNHNETLIKLKRDIGFFEKSLIAVSASKENMYVLAEMPYRIPKEKLLHFLEYIARVNFGMLRGSFSMNMKTDKVFYKVSSHWQKGLLPSENLIISQINICIKMLRYYSLSLKTLLESDISVLDAIAIVEK